MASRLKLFFFLSSLFLTACTSMQQHEQIPTENVMVVQRQLDAYNAHDLQSFVATYSDDVVVYRVPSTTPILSGKQKLSEFYRHSRFNLPSLHAALVHRTVIGNKVIDHERITGLRDQPVEAVAAYIVQDGLIKEVWLFYAD